VRLPDVWAGATGASVSRPGAVPRAAGVGRLEIPRSVRDAPVFPIGIEPQVSGQAGADDTALAVIFGDLSTRGRTAA